MDYSARPTIGGELGQSGFLQSKFVLRLRVEGVLRVIIPTYPISNS